ncbi:MAG: alpha amylase C-terminal domain-containing protein [Myxococcales bacterium]
MLGAALVLTAPGVPMLFMGQELLERGGFTDPPPPLDWSKEQTYRKVEGFYRDLIRLRRNADGVSAGLTCPTVEVTHVNTGAKVIAYRRRCADGQGEVVVVANFAGTHYPRYDVGLPSPGTWHVRVDSDDLKYGDDFGAGQTQVVAQPVERDGLPYFGAMNLGKYSVLVLSR